MKNQTQPCTFLTISHWIYPGFVWLIQMTMVAVVTLMFSHIIQPAHHHIPYFWSWDGGAYIEIAKHGYTDARLPGFFPLYPLLIHILHFIPGMSYQTSSLMINDLSLLAALIILFCLVQETQNTAVAKRTLWLIMVFPTAMFFLVAYTESLTLLTFVLFFYLLQHQRWYWAMLVGFFSTLVHDLNFLLVFAGLAYLWSQRQTLGKHTVIVRFLSLAIIPLSLIIWMGYLYFKTGDPIAFVHAADTYWYKRYVIPVFHQFKFLMHTIHHLPGPDWNFSIVMIINGVFTLIMVLMGILLLTRYRYCMSFEQRVFYIIYLLATLIPASGNGSLESIARYMIVIFPGFIVWALISKREWVFLASVATMLPIKTILLGMFINGYWIT